MFIMLEGPDGAGKTTLANSLQLLLPGATYTHHGPAAGLTPNELSGSYMASMKPAFMGDLILDRGWLSEPIYSRVYRKTDSRVSSAHQRMLERAALALNMKLVICLPPFADCAMVFKGRDELLEDISQLRDVYQGYTVDLMTSLPAAKYDYTAGETAAELLSRLPDRPTPKVILIGDRPTTTNPHQSKFQVPFVSFNGRGCSEWLAVELDEGCVNEADLCWFNAYSSTLEHLDPDRLPVGLPVIALGSNASAWCRAHSISHRLAPHPQYHKRFYNDKPYPLIGMLKEITQ